MSVPNLHRSNSIVWLLLAVSEHAIAYGCSKPNTGGRSTGLLVWWSEVAPTNVAVTGCTLNPG